MKPKDKAKELVDRFKDMVMGDIGGIIELFNAKQCALICVYEMEEQLRKLMLDKNLDIGANATAYVMIKDLEEIKQEINQL